MAWHKGEKYSEVVNGITIGYELADRFLSDDCEEGKHQECGESSLMSLCGCTCHDAADGSL